jgi:hypothetical protein
LGSAVALAFAAILAIGGTAAAAARPVAAPSEASTAAPSASLLWQRVCESAAGGTISLQPALVCVHVGFPQWGVGALTLLEHVCEDALGGTYVRRSEFPVELAACFFD